MDNDLNAAYERCRELHRRHGRTYYFATRLLPAWKRRHVHALYGFTRYSDEIVDRTRNGDAASDRPEGVSRNSGQLPNSFNVDVRIARSVPVGPVALEATMDVFNLLNRQNVLQVNGVRYRNAQLAPNPQFGAATIVADPRRIQFGLRASF